jgi:prolyl oligopeptidase
MTRPLYAFLALLVATSMFSADPPRTERKAVTDVIHGVEIVDPYRWLEGSAAPELKGKADPELDAKVAAWTDAQNAYTRDVLDHLPGRSQLESRLRQLLEIDSITAPVTRRDRYFFQKREGSQAQYVTYMQKGAKGEPRVILDPNAMDKEGLVAPDFMEPNPDGTRMAFGLYRAGDENTTLYVMNTDSGEWLADEIPGKVGDVNWLPDSSGFFYSRLADIKNPYSTQIKFHKLGTHQRQDPVLFEQYKEGPLATTWGPFATTDRSGRWMILGYWTGTDSNDLWVVDLDRWFRTGEFVRREIVTGQRAISNGPVIGDILYMKTTLDAPNGRILAVDLRQPDRPHWEEIIPEKKDAFLQDLSAARDYLLTAYLKNASTSLQLYRMDGAPAGTVALPGIGAAEVTTNEDRNEAFFTYQSFNEPTSVYRVALGGGGPELWARPKAPIDPRSIEVTQVFYPSKDGTKVPMFLVHKKGLKLDGSNPTILYGYGGFDISETPAFSATYFPWFEAGGVYALANLRGGGELGEAWHRAGMLEKKQNVFDDFISAAEWLIANHYTSPGRLAIYGGSNGGLLTGAALVQRPELFGAVISAVPLLDMLRYQNYLMARYWVPEYGSAEDPEQFGFLKKYSPYQNVKPGLKYPAVLFTAGENDARVHALHARKMTALMQASTSNDQSKHPILLWVERSAGHGQGKPLNLRVRDAADIQIFLMWQLGMLNQKAGD